MAKRRKKKGCCGCAGRSGAGRRKTCGMKGNGMVYAGGRYKAININMDRGRLRNFSMHHLNRRKNQERYLRQKELKKK